MTKYHDEYPVPPSDKWISAGFSLEIWNDKDSSYYRGFQGRYEFWHYLKMPLGHAVAVVRYGYGRGWFPSHCCATKKHGAPIGMSLTDACAKELRWFRNQLNAYYTSAGVDKENKNRLLRNDFWQTHSIY